MNRPHTPVSPISYQWCNLTICISSHVPIACHIIFLWWFPLFHSRSKNQMEKMINVLEEKCSDLKICGQRISFASNRMEFIKSRWCLMLAGVSRLVMFSQLLKILPSDPSSMGSASEYPDFCVSLSTSSLQIRAWGQPLNILTSDPGMVSASEYPHIQCQPLNILPSDPGLGSASEYPHFTFQHGVGLSTIFTSDPKMLVSLTSDPSKG